MNNKTNKDSVTTHKDVVSEIIRAKRPHERKMHWAMKLFLCIVGVGIIYGAVLAGKAYASFKNVTVTNEGSSSPLLRLPMTIRR